MYEIYNLILTTGVNRAPNGYAIMTTKTEHAINNIQVNFYE
jgi:hypothetical protein